MSVFALICFGQVFSFVGLLTIAAPTFFFLTPLNSVIFLVSFHR